MSAITQTICTKGSDSAQPSSLSPVAGQEKRVVSACWLEYQGYVPLGIAGGLRAPVKKGGRITLNSSYVIMDK